MLFVNFDAVDDWLIGAGRRRAPQVEENLEPLAGFGVSAGWQDDDWTHTVLRLTTD